MDKEIRHPFLFLLFIVIAALVFQAACPEPSDAMTLTPAGPRWVIDFEPHEANVGVVVVTQCHGTDFFAYDSFPILDPASSHLSVRRQPVPRGARCTVQADVMRQKDDDPAHDYIGESTIVIQKGDGAVETVPPADEEAP